MEPDSEWARQMQTLMREMVHASKEWLGDDAATDGPPPEQEKEWEERCDEILRQGREHYIQNPPTKHYLEGHNTPCKLAEDKDKWLSVYSQAQCTACEQRGGKGTSHAQESAASGSDVPLREVHR